MVTMKKCTFWFLLIGVAIVGASWPALTTRCNAEVSGPAANSEIKWLTDYDAALKQAKASNQLVVIDFYSPRCGPCKYMDLTTFKDAKVSDRLAGYVPLKINGDEHEELMMKYGAPAFPTMLVVDATGKPILGTVGYVDAGNYLTVLDMANTKYAGTNSVKTAAPPASPAAPPAPGSS